MYRWADLPEVDIKYASVREIIPPILLRSKHLDGRHESDDIQLVGNFIHLGHDQVLFINNTTREAHGRVLIADLSSGKVPAQVKY